LISPNGTRVEFLRDNALKPKLASSLKEFIAVTFGMFDILDAANNP
jgi:hypothetical protein